MKTAAQALAKWEASTSLGADTWATNVQNTTKPIVSAAIAQRSVMQANFNRSTEAGGLWEQRLSAVGDAGIKAAVQNSKAQYSAGVTRGATKMGASLTKILAYENAGLPAIYAMPSGTTAAGVARASAWIQYMAAGKGQLGA